MLSFGITVNNPNTLGNNACSMKIGWKDALNQWHDFVDLLCNTGYQVNNGWDPPYSMLFFTRIGTA